jgi:hypothetical protein
MTFTAPLPFPEITSPKVKKGGRVSEVLMGGRFITFQRIFAGTVTFSSCVPPSERKVSGVARGLRWACMASAKRDRMAVNVDRSMAVSLSQGTEIPVIRRNRPAFRVAPGDYICRTLHAMPLFRNFTYWIDKRRWKYVFLLTTLELAP